jgi:NAD-dependent dihydropyrimidine dehydrogenase PreA subunit
MLKSYPNATIIAHSNFEVAVDAETCTGCGDCLDRCQVGALDLSDEVVQADKDRCVGCGNCVTVCPTESLSMVRRKDEKPPVIGDRFAGLGV